MGSSLAFWPTQNLSSLGAAFYASDEFKIVSLQLVQLYRVFKGREPAYYTEYLPEVFNFRNGSHTARTLATQFVAESGVTTTPQVLSLLCTNLNPGGGAAAAGCISASANLTQLSPVDAALLFLASPSYTGAQRDAVYLMYAVTLNRPPDQSGFEFWLGAMTANNYDINWLVTAFVASPEFQMHFN